MSIEWKINQKSTHELGDIRISEDSWCEHCETLEPFEPQFGGGGTYWCYDCITSDGEEIPDDIYKEAKRISAIKRVIYYSEKISNLRKELFELLDDKFLF